jgi:membrane protease subunit HflC
MKFKWIGLGILALVFSNGFFVISEIEQAIVTRFGEPVGSAIQTAGLHFKFPVIDKVYRFDKRIMEWDGEPRQIPTSDKRFIWVDTFSRWQIVDPLKFYETTRTEERAHSRLDDIVGGDVRDMVSSFRLIDFVRNSNREMEYSVEFEEIDGTKAKQESIFYGRKTIADSIHTISSPQIEEYGIKLIDVQIKRLNYVDEVRQNVYARMISERMKIAEKYRSEGQGNAAEILGKLRRELDQIESQAYKTAQEIIGKADAQAILIYADAYNKDPQFYEFFKTLETYEKTINEKTVMIMTTDSDYYQHLKRVK